MNSHTRNALITGALFTALAMFVWPYSEFTANSGIFQYSILCHALLPMVLGTTFAGLSLAMPERITVR